MERAFRESCRDDRVLVRRPEIERRSRSQRGEVGRCWLWTRKEAQTRECKRFEKLQRRENALPWSLQQDSPTPHFTPDPQKPKIIPGVVLSH